MGLATFPEQNMRVSRTTSKNEAVETANPYRSSQPQTAFYALRENTLLLSGVALIVVSASMMLSTLIG